MRVMAIDYGDARTGVAISDPAGLLAGYTTVIQSRRPELAAEEIAKLAAERQVDELCRLAGGKGREDRPPVGRAAHHH